MSLCPSIQLALKVQLVTLLQIYYMIYELILCHLQANKVLILGKVYVLSNAFVKVYAFEEVHLSADCDSNFLLLFLLMYIFHITAEAFA